MRPPNLNHNRDLNLNPPGAVPPRTGPNCEFSNLKSEIMGYRPLSSEALLTKEDWPSAIRPIRPGHLTIDKLY